MSIIESRRFFEDSNEPVVTSPELSASIGCVITARLCENSSDISGTLSFLAQPRCHIHENSSCTAAGILRLVRNVFWSQRQNNHQTCFDNETRKKKKGELNTSACDLFLPVLQHFCKVLHWREYSPHDSLFNCMSSVSL